MKYNKLNKSKYKYKGGRIFGRKGKSKPNDVPQEKETSYDVQNVFDKGLKSTSTLRNKLNISDTQASNILGLSEIGDEENKEKAEMLKDKKLKIEKKSMDLAKSRGGLLVDVFYNFGFNIVNMYIYLISSLINLPNNTLENIIPEKGGCNLLFSDESTCKKKIKCLFKKCTILEDKDGYIIDYKKIQRQKLAKQQKGGRSKHLDPKTCKYRGESCKMYPSETYDGTPPLALYAMMKGERPTLKLKHITSQIKNIISPFARKINKIQFEGGAAFQPPYLYPSGNSNLFESNPLKVPEHLSRLYQNNNDSSQYLPMNQPDMFLKNQNPEEIQKAKAQAMLLYAVVKEHMKLESVYKFLLLMKMMSIVYGDVGELESHIESSRDDENTELFTRKPEIVNIPFPFVHAVLDTASERVECLMAHLMGISPEEFENNPTLKTCFSCKTCTLMGQSSQVMKDLYEQLVDGSNLTFSGIFDTLFDFFSNAFDFNVNAKKSLLQFIVNYKMNDRAVNIDSNFFHQKLRNAHSYRDALLMIPDMQIKEEFDVENNDVFKQNKHLYAYMKSMGMEKVLTYYLYQKLYLKPIKIISQSKRISEIKENIHLIMGCQKSFLTSENAGEIEGVLKLLKKINANDFDAFRARDEKERKNLLEQIIQNESVEDDDIEHYYKYGEIYTKLITGDVSLDNLEEEESDEKLKTIIGKLQSEDK